MLLSTEAGSVASSSARRCCKLPADSGFSHIQASSRDSVMLEVCTTVKSVGSYTF